MSTGAAAKPPPGRLARNLKIARRTILALVVVFLAVLGGLVWWARGRGIDDGEIIDGLREAGEEIPAGMADGAALGDASAPVTLVVFADFQCPFCLRYTALTEPVIVQEYVATGQVRLQFRHFPRLGEESELAAEAAACAAEQGQFWPFHNRLFLVQAEAHQASEEKLNVGRFAPAELRTIAEELELDLEAFDGCLESGSGREAVQADIASGVALGVRGVPSFAIGEEVVLLGMPRSADVLREILDARLR